MSTNIFANDIALDGSRTSDRVNRKVELQSPADLTYLIAKVSKTAREKIDKHLPPDAAVQGEDRMRSRVEMLVDDYIRNTFNLAKPNLSINGMDSKEIEAELARAQEGEEFEPFDVRLVECIQSLSSQIEAHTLELANMRRTAPAETAKRFQEAYKAQDEAMRAQLDVDNQVRSKGAQDTVLQPASIERLSDIQHTWQTSSDTLDNLRSGIDAATRHAERAQKSMDYVVNS